MEMILVVWVMYQFWTDNLVRILMEIQIWIYRQIDMSIKVIVMINIIIMIIIIINKVE